MTGTSDPPEKPELGVSGADVTVAVARSFLSIVPVLGQALQEIVTALVPNQRTERFEKYLLFVLQELELLKVSVDAIKKPENIDLIEDGAYQAVRALTDERKRLIAKAVAKGIASEDQTKFDEKRIMNLLGQLDDEQITMLAAYGSGFVHSRLQEIRPPFASHGSTDEVKERAWFFEWCESELMRLGLLHRRVHSPRTGGFVEITWLGKAVLRAVDLLPAKAD